MLAVQKAGTQIRSTALEAPVAHAWLDCRRGRNEALKVKQFHGRHVLVQKLLAVDAFAPSPSVEMRPMDRMNDAR